MIKLLSYKKQRFIKSNYIFVSANNNPLKDIERGVFNCTKKICKTDNSHFHNLRYTRASRNTQIFTQQELGGWGNLGNGKKYAHMNDEHLSHFSNAVTIWSQNRNKYHQALNFPTITD